MAFAGSVIVPEEMSIRTSISICLVILTITISAILAAWLFSRLTPTRRRDVIKLVKTVTDGLRRLP